jgi:hypothetical protein
MQNLNENKIVIEIPFSGFYHSIHDQYIDLWLDYMTSNDEAEFLGITQEELEDRLYTMDYSSIRKAICLHYIEAYNAVFYDEHDIDLELSFHAMTSPKFYNFETDRIYCDIDQSKFNEVIALLDDDKIQSVLSGKYRTQAGFIVFDSTLQAIQNKDYVKFSSDILEMLLSENTVIDNYQYTDLIHEVIANNAEF